MAQPRCGDCGGDVWTKDGRCSACRSYPTLGYAVATLIQQTCVIPDGDHQGDPYLLTDEQLRFCLNHYRLDPNVRYDKRARRWTMPFVYYRGAQLTRPQKWGKGPFSAALVIAECHPEGPVLFDGWDADGQPVGRPWATPHWQITAVNEDQTDNVWRVLQPMIELGALAADIPDTGVSRINLPSGGLIEPVTSSGNARLGQRITGCVQDEPHSWVESNGGHKVAYTQRRNLAGTGGRFVATGNAWDPNEDSAAQRLAESGDVGVYHDDVEPKPGSVRNKRDVLRMIKEVYGDSWWVDPNRIASEIAALVADNEAAMAERFFLNRKEAGESAAFDYEKWKTLKRGKHEVPAGALITIGVDGARFHDSLAVIATEVATGFQWPISIQERPDDADETYEHDFEAVDGAVDEAFDEYSVWRLYADPQKIDSLMDTWQGRWGEKRVVAWYTNRPRQIGYAVRNYTQAMGAGDVTHDGDDVFSTHIKQAHKQKLNVRDEKGDRMHSIGKVRKKSPLKMDAAMAAVIAWECRGDAIADGATAEAEPLVRVGG